VYRTTLLLLMLLTAPSSASSNPVTALAGRYYEQFPDGTIDGNHYTGENIVEIVPVTSSAAYLRIELDFFNGHHCSLAGVASATGSELIYREPGYLKDRGDCTIHVRRLGKSLAIDDDSGACNVGHCGSRGGLANVRLPYASKRPIRYLPRLRSSEDYRDAIQRWRKEHS
jgi:hypothetical protein